MSEATATRTRTEEYRAAIGDVPTGPTAGYAVDGIEPEVVVLPRNESEIATSLAEADALGLSVIARGGGEHITRGNTPASYDVALSLERVPESIEHVPADLTVTASASTTLAALNGALLEHGQYLPVDPPCDPARATVGGMIATGAYGPRRHARGTPRDWLIGVRIVLADGTATKAGGRVVKNVAGYEMTKLYCGSLGTLGVITQATLRTAPLPPSTATAAVTCDSAAAATDIVLAAWDSGLAFEAAEVLSPTAGNAVVGDARWAALLRAAGGHAAVDRSLRDLGALASVYSGRMTIHDEESAWDAWGRAFAPRDVTFVGSVRPSAVASTIATMDRRLAGAGFALSATVSAGVIRGVMRPPAGSATIAAIAAAHAVVERHGGTMVIESAPPAAKAALDVFGEPRGDIAIMRRIKEEFDPRRTLSPGRFIGRL